MKKVISILSVFAVCFALSGCIDIFQHITRENTGRDYNQIKFTVSKAVLAMADKNIDYDKWLEENGEVMSIKEYNGFSAEIKKINDELDIGYLINMDIDYRDQNTLTLVNNNTTSFIPKYEGKNVKIHIDALGDSSDSSESNAMAMAFLATGKYRLLIDKKCINAIKKVSIKTAEGESDTNFIDLHNEYLIEIPIPIIFMTAVDLIIYSM